MRRDLLLEIEDPDLQRRRSCVDKTSFDQTFHLLHIPSTLMVIMVIITVIMVIIMVIMVIMVMEGRR